MMETEKMMILSDIGDDYGDVGLGGGQVAGVSSADGAVSVLPLHGCSNARASRRRVTASRLPSL